MLLVLIVEIQVLVVVPWKAGLRRDIVFSEPNGLGLNLQRPSLSYLSLLLQVHFLYSQELAHPQLTRFPLPNPILLLEV